MSCFIPSAALVNRLLGWLVGLLNTTFHDGASIGTSGTNAHFLASGFRVQGLGFEQCMFHGWSRLPAERAVIACRSIHPTKQRRKKKGICPRSEADGERAILPVLLGLGIQRPASVQIAVGDVR